MTSRKLNFGGRSRFVPNTVALIAQTVFATLVTLLQVKLLSNLLSRETFGLFASLRGFSFLLSMLAANGLPQLLLRFIPVHEAHRDQRSALRLSAICVVVSLAVLSLLTGIAYAYRSRFFSFAGPVGLEPDLLFWFFATTAGVMVKQVIYGALNGLRRFTVQLVLETLSLLAVLVWIIIERNNLSLVVLFRILGLAHVVTVGIALPAYFVLLAKATGVPGGLVEGVRTQSYRSYAIWAGALSVVALAFSDVDRYVLAQVLTLDLLALFHIAARVSRLSNRVLGVANLAFQPEITRLDSEGRADRIDFSTRIFMKFNLVIAFAMAFAISVFSREIIVVVASRDYVGAAPLLVILALCLPLSTLTAPITTVMKARDQVRGALAVDGVWAVSYIGLMLSLAPHLGLVGAGIAQLFACLAQLLVALRISKLTIELAFVGRLVGRLLVAGLASFSPAIAVGLVGRGDVTVAPAVLKAGLFLAGTVLFQRLLRRLGTFEDEERATLTLILQRRRLSFILRFL